MTWLFVAYLIIGVVIALKGVQITAKYIILTGWIDVVLLAMDAILNVVMWPAVICTLRYRHRKNVAEGKS